ncbi:nickel pincer cofactor biosynthesis protein LarC [Oceanospirillaceae bacterium]|jgi:uncharacterized protein (TIGR00299 family) protein|nr:nickel pincer cofactor biosynthesis protein LarC [Oceanospirillaceae bacterium]|tara:strand:- start:176 stop:1348 length:1173 start_codon:yes stop_codon:yes gene_type:complete
MKILYYDCFAGISGDMNLGAMIDLGVDQCFLRTELEKLNISGFHLEITPDLRCGISGTKATVIIENPGNKKHRHLRDIHELINRSDISDKTKSKSLEIFQLIAESEAKVHRIDIEKVHFHEVGALDSIVDIVGAAICLDYLNVDQILSSPIQLGGGTVKCEHGIMPVPAPATALIVAGVPVKMGLLQHEATTPTGAAILVATVDQFTEQINFSIAKTAYGIGQRDISDIPNVLRLYLSEVKQGGNEPVIEVATLLECNIDDMNPEHFEYLLDLLLQKGARDVWFTPIIMKKSRPAITVSILCMPDSVEKLKKVVFQNSTTIGLREYLISKTVLRREKRLIETEFGSVHVKESFYEGKSIQIKPEYDDCKALAINHNVSIKEIETAVLKKL